MNKITDEVLLDYIDGALDKADEQFIKKQLQSDMQLRARLHDLKKADKHLMGDILHPSVNFTDTVWKKISNMGSAPRLSLNGLLIVLAAMVTVVLGSYFMTDSIIDINLNVGVPSSVTEYVKVPEVELPKGINLKIISQILLYSISFLLLLILDRAILKPYFRRRRQLFGH
ncbi:MAG: hypothetical protein AAGF85_06695 [Bacteroidota bacterium]